MAKRSSQTRLRREIDEATQLRDSARVRELNHLALAESASAAGHEAQARAYDLSGNAELAVRYSELAASARRIAADYQRMAEEAARRVSGGER